MTNFFSYFEKLSLGTILKFSTKLFLFLLPWQTVWIYREVTIKGVKWQFGTLGIYATEIILWLVIFLFMFWYLGKLKDIRDKIEFKLSKDRLFLSTCLLFVIYAFAGAFWAYDPSLLIQQSLIVTEGLLLFLVITVGPFDLKNLTFWFVGGGLVQALLATFQFLTQSTFSSVLLGLSQYPVWQSGVSVVESSEIGRWLRAYGSFAHPNILGGYLTFCLIAAVSTFLGSSKHNKKQTIYFLISFVLLSIGVLFSFSRTAWFASALIVLFSGSHVLIQNKDCSTKYIRTLIIGALPILFLLFVFVPLLDVRVNADSSTEVRSLTQRVSKFNQALEVFDNHKVLGTGAGNYTAVLQKTIPDKPGWYYQPVHNSFMLFLVEFGLIGLVIFILVANNYIKVFNFENEVNPDTVFIGLSILVTIVVIGSFDHYLVSSYIGIILVSLMIGLFTKFHLKSVDIKINDS